LVVGLRRTQRGVKRLGLGGEFEVMGGTEIGLERGMGGTRFWEKPRVI